MRIRVQFFNHWKFLRIESLTFNVQLRVNDLYVFELKASHPTFGSLSNLMVFSY